MELPLEGPVHNSPTVGSIVKKIIGINPELNTSEIIALIRQATHKTGIATGSFSGVEIVDEALALDLARQTLN